MGRIFHIATESDWEGARRAGRYTTSTLGRSLAEEGFIHASRADQWQLVRARFYADVAEPLVLLVIDTERLEVPVLTEAVPGTDDTFPHVYGPLNLDAVVRAVPLAGDERRPSETFGTVFLREVLRNLGPGLVLLTLAAAGTLAGLVLAGAGGAGAGLAAGLTAGVWWVVRSERRRRSPSTGAR